MAQQLSTPRKALLTDGKDQRAELQKITEIIACNITVDGISTNYDDAKVLSTLSSITPICLYNHSEAYDFVEAQKPAHQKNKEVHGFTDGYTVFLNAEYFKKQDFSTQLNLVKNALLEGFFQKPVSATILKALQQNSKYPSPGFNFVQVSPENLSQFLKTNFTRLGISLCQEDLVDGSMDYLKSYSVYNTPLERGVIVDECFEVVHQKVSREKLDYYKDNIKVQADKFLSSQEKPSFMSSGFSFVEKVKSFELLREVQKLVMEKLKQEPHRFDEWVSHYFKCHSLVVHQKESFAHIIPTLHDFYYQNNKTFNTDEMLKQKEHIIGLAQGIKSFNDDDIKNLTFYLKDDQWLENIKSDEIIPLYFQRLAVEYLKNENLEEVDKMYQRNPSLFSQKDLILRTGILDKYLIVGFDNRCPSMPVLDYLNKIEKHFISFHTKDCFEYYHPKIQMMILNSVDRLLKFVPRPDFFVQGSSEEAVFKNYIQKNRSIYDIQTKILLMKTCAKNNNIELSDFIVRESGFLNVFTPKGWNTELSNGFYLESEILTLLKNKVMSIDSVYEPLMRLGRPKLCEYLRNEIVGTILEKEFPLNSSRKITL